MCGIAGLLTAPNICPQLQASLERDAQTMRDALAHRGPDDKGTWQHADEHATVVLTHRRLTVRDTSSAGHQPMGSAQGALVYNGELYNQRDVHQWYRRLASERTHEPAQCDTATVLASLDQVGSNALTQFRGMYALAYYSLVDHTLTLARDPMGIKPVYWTVLTVQGTQVFAFASEIAALRAHPCFIAKPDPVTISAYLTTIRTTLGERTMFNGVQTLLPGQSITVRIDGNTPTIVRALTEVENVGTSSTHAQTYHNDVQSVVERTRECITHSVRAHLCSDVPVCCLLSGGLDSSIIASVMHDEIQRAAQTGPGSNQPASRLATWCAASDETETDDLLYAREMASHLGTDHHEVIITREMFLRDWLAMIAQSGLPLSTPNEIAIAAIGRDIRDAGYVVAMSGEGADELFAGYDQPLCQIADAYARNTPVSDTAELDMLAWMPMEMKELFLTDNALSGAHNDTELRAYAQETIASERDRLSQAHTTLSDQEMRTRAHLAYSRRTNLVGLLGRLDSSLMLGSIEGRTPFADAMVASFAASLPIDACFSIGADGQVDTKRALREAFSDVLPASVVHRPKRSFPLPFREWIGDASRVLSEAVAVRQWIKPELVDAVAASPTANWRVAWPIMNLAIWCESVFGDPCTLERMTTSRATMLEAQPPTRQAV